MRTVRVMSRLSLLLALGAVLIAVQGCTGQQVRQYVRYRAEDFCDLLDVGFTFSKKPQIAIFGNGISVCPGGYGKIDGYFLGFGGGQFGWTRHYMNCWGLLAIGQERYAWTEYDPEDLRTMTEQFTGVLGVPFFPVFSTGPQYMPACIHYIHLGWIGVVANARYMEALDFVLGFTTLDLGGDDGTWPGKWPWKRKRARRPSELIMGTDVDAEAPKPAEQIKKPQKPAKAPESAPSGSEKTMSGRPLKKPPPNTEPKQGGAVPFW